MGEPDRREVGHRLRRVRRPEKHAEGADSGPRSARCKRELGRSYHERRQVLTLWWSCPVPIADGRRVSSRSAPSLSRGRLRNMEYASTHEKHSPVCASDYS